MKILLLSIGSRGDIQPFIALGLGLKKAGYEVAVCTAESHQSWVREYGLDYAHMTDEFMRLSETQEGRAAVESRKSGLKLIQKAKPMIRQMLDDAWIASQDIDAIVYHPKAMGGYHIAEKLGIPGFMSIPLPLYTPTREFPVPILSPSLQLGGTFNRLTYKLLGLVGAPFAGVVNDWREQVLNLRRRSSFASELKRSDGTDVPILYSYSPHVLPAPADWPVSAVATGYWFLPRQQDWQPPAELQAFLDAGTPPVYIGFGSMTGTNPEAKARLVLDALRKSGQRGLIATGWGGLKPSDLPDDVMMIEQAPHDWLFEQVAAVVHHGGAGTTAAGLRAGRPTVICPFLADQPFWGWRVYQLGVGPEPIPQKKLTADLLASAIHAAVTDAEMRRRARELGEKIRAEDGVGRAASIIRERIGAALTL